MRAHLHHWISYVAKYHTTLTNILDGYFNNLFYSKSYIMFTTIVAVCLFTIVSADIKVLSAEGGMGPDNCARVCSGTTGMLRANIHHELDRDWYFSRN